VNLNPFYPMALKSLKVNVLEKATAKKEEIPAFAQKGDICSRFNTAKENLKVAEAVVKELEPELKAKALPNLFEFNVANPNNPISSVKLVDSTDSVVRISFTKKYSAANADLTEQVFEGLGADINEYVQRTVKVAFDNKVFLDKDGNFSEKVYDAFKKAIDEVSKKLNVESPLTGKEVVEPKPNFHDIRWEAFPTIESQGKLYEALKNVVSLTPVVG